MALLSIVSVLTIRAEAIDHDRARGLHRGRSESQEKPVLPLVGQKLALQDENEGTALMSGCIVAAQVVMVPMAALVGHKADIWGRKPLFLAGLAILSLRGFLYPLSNDRFWFAVQSLDGVGAGLYGALFPLIVADLTRGTGRFNLAQGAVITAQGIGAALSTSLAGLVVVHVGFSAAFLVPAGIAASGFLLYLFGTPETRGLDAVAPSAIAKRALFP
jgi:MFS family permease